MLKMRYVLQVPSQIRGYRQVGDKVGTAASAQAMSPMEWGREVECFLSYLCISKELLGGNATSVSRRVQVSKH